MVVYTKIANLDVIESDSNVEILYSIFCNPSKKCVLVTEDGKFLGTIHRDTFINSREKSGQDNVINREMITQNSPCLLENDGTYDQLKEMATGIMLQKGRECIIPVVNTEGKLLYSFSQNEKNREHVEKLFYEKYSLLLQAGYSLADYFQNKGIKKIAIYGTEDLCVRIYNEVNDYSGVDIEFIMGHRKSLIGDMKSIGWSDIASVQVQQVDLMVVTYLNTFEGLKHNLLRCGFRNVISIQTIVDEMYAYAFEIRPFIELFQSLQEKKISVLCVHMPDVSELSNKSERESILYENKLKPEKILESFDEYKNVLLDGIKDWYDEIYVQDAYFGSPKVTYKKGYCINVDGSSKAYNVVDGKRVTVNVPETYEHEIHMLGKSWTFGNYVKEEHTISSLLQKTINNFEKKRYAVFNHGVSGTGLQEWMNRIKALELNCGDIVVLIQNAYDFERVYKKTNLPFLNLSRIVQRPHDNGELYIDYEHFNPRGNELSTQEIYKKLFYENKVSSQKGYNEFYVKQKQILTHSYLYECGIENTKPFLDYLMFLKNERINTRGKIGSIVMNCNPFTKGHRYLIEYAAKQMDILYVFVVEEDKSFFRFKDRYEMIRVGTADIKNVKIVPSGKFIVSSVTFPGYFVKEQKQDAIVDASMDLEMFGSKIAPILEIKYRFAGSEPIDKVTKQYNQQMATILPKYGIQFIEIERINAGNGVISASRVRKLMEENKWNELSDLLPETTIHYLKEQNIGV